MSAGLPKTVLYIVDSLGLSGKTRTMAYVASHLDPREFRPVVCTFGDEASVLIDQLRERGIPIHSLPCRDGIDLRMIPRVAALMKSLNASVVHCYNPRPILYGGLAAKWRRVRGTVGSLSAFACQVPDRTYGFLPQALNTDSRRNVYRNRISARLMRYLVTVSEGLGKRFCEYNAVPLAKLRIVPYGADLSAMAHVSDEEAASLRQEIGFAPDHVVIGSVGRLVEQKDYPTQLKAFALAARQIPALRMVLAGDGPLDRPLRQLAHDLGVDNRVAFLGHWERVPCLLRSLDVFVLASKFEPFGVSLLEAKAAGLPIAATNVNEIPEILSDGASGLLCPPEDPERLARLFEALASDSCLRARLGAQALLEAKERHSLEAVARAYQTLYQASLN